MAAPLAIAAMMVASAAPRHCPYDAEIAKAVASAAPVYPVSAALVKAVIVTESSCVARAVSRAGALGLMQLLPATAAMMGARPEELFTPARNILLGTRFLALLLRRYHGNLWRVLVAYNAGPHRQRATLPSHGETLAYVRRVLAYLDDFDDFAVPQPALADRYP